MDINKWEVFIKVAEVQNVTTAADELNISQSGVSYILKSLEKEIGFPLFTRHKRGVILTPNAEEILPAIHEFLNQKENIEQIMSQINGLNHGRLRISTLQSVSMTWLPKVLKQFNNDYPNITFDIREGGNTIIEEALFNHEVDLCLTGYQPHLNSIEWIDLEQDCIMAVLPPNHKYAAADYVPLEMFIDESFLYPDSTYYQDIHFAFKKNNIVPKNVVCKSRDDFAIIAMTKEGIGSSLLYSKILEAYAGKDLIVKDIKPPIIRRLGIAIHSMESTSPVAKVFIKYIKDYINSVEYQSSKVNKI